MREVKLGDSEFTHSRSMVLPVRYADFTPSERRLIRLEYIRRQGGLCHHCKCSLDGEPPEKIRKAHINWAMFPKGFLDHPIHLHHNKQTGYTIGAVHARCNAYLFYYEGE